MKRRAAGRPTCLSRFARRSQSSKMRTHGPPRLYSRVRIDRPTDRVEHGQFVRGRRRTTCRRPAATRRRPPGARSSRRRCIHLDRAVNQMIAGLRAADERHLRQSAVEDAVPISRNAFQLTSFRRANRARRGECAAGRPGLPWPRPIGTRRRVGGSSHCLVR